MFFSWLSCDCHVTVLPLCRLLTKWARALQSTLSDLQEYIKTYHTIGPSWNPEVCTVGGVCCRGCVCGWVRGCGMKVAEQHVLFVARRVVLGDEVSCLVDQRVCH